MKGFAKFMLWIMGWKIDPVFPGRDQPKAVIVHAPHTSNWDFFLGWLSFKAYGRKIKFLVKKEAFTGIRGWFVKAMGGIPVDRSRKTRIVDQVVKLVQESDDMLIMFTPEGTRKHNPDWKSGFYYVAQKADVPIYLCYMDYTKKYGGWFTQFEMTGDAKADIETMKEYYKDIDGKYPELGVH